MEESADNVVGAVAKRGEFHTMMEKGGPYRIRTDDPRFAKAVL